MSYRTLLVERDPQGIVLCTLNRPEVHNALNLEMVEELHRLLDALATDDGVRVLIVTGAGERAFLGGADIGELRDRKRADALRRINSALFTKLEQLPQPTIAAIRGFALGGGTELALACDLRVCGEGARLGQPEVGLGIIPAAGGAHRLPRVVGTAMARELIFTGRIIDATEAERIGLVNRVVPDDQVLSAARELASQIAANSPLAVRLAKVALNAAPELSTAAAMALESTAQAVLFEDEEKYRRMTAFLERKQARAKQR